MFIANSTGHRHAAAILEDPAGRERLVVAVKATCRLSTLARDDDLAPLPVRLADEYAPNGELVAPCEVVLARPGTNVICLGTALAPGGRPSPRVAVDLMVGSMTQRLVVFGERRWQRTADGYAPSEPEPFVSLSLGFCQAFGGASGDQISEYNPIGRGFWDPASADSPEGAPLPRIEDPRALMARPEDRPAVASLGAIAPSWRPQRDFAETYDEAWRRTRAPALPLDFDERFFQVGSGPLAGRELLRGGEPVELAGMTRGAPISGTLPRIGVRLIVGGRTLVPQLDLVVLEPDVDRLSLCFRSAIDVTGRLDALPPIRIVEKGVVARNGAPRSADGDARLR